MYTLSQAAIDNGYKLPVVEEKPEYELPILMDGQDEEC